ncbi:MAG TPA: hypothetical protein VIB00_13260 [Pyrinomonadaceae bacterium]
MSADSTRQQLPSSHLENVIVTRQRDLVDGFKVRRALASARRRMVGPFIFLDQLGPEVLRDVRGLDVAHRRGLARQRALHKKVFWDGSAAPLR